MRRFRSDAGWWLGTAGFAAFALAALAEPLAAYSLSLALFGLPHVLSELRYVDRRFGRRVGRGWLARVLAILAAIVAVRCATVIGLIAPELGVPVELLGVALLALACAGGSLARRAVAFGIGSAIGLAALLAPFSTATLFSIGHNLTPLAFVWELAPHDRARRWLGLAAIPLLALPLLVATGLPRWLSGIGDADADPLGAGPLAAHLYVYVPAALAEGRHSVDLFTASVVAQGGHYLTVILVLPFLLNRREPFARGLIAWPATAPFAVLLAVIGALAFARFTEGFAQARSLYGIAASFHAWLEIPLLILILTGQRASSRPTTSDTEFASSETSIA